MSTGYLTTHILDTSRGCPASGVSITLSRLDGSSRSTITETTTNSDGRTDAPLIPQGDLSTGIYELEFSVGSYFSASGVSSFLDIVPVRFEITDSDSHYHIPLLVSPYGYSTYRGS